MFVQLRSMRSWALRQLAPIFNKLGESLIDEG
jgi:hypothetical protein